MTKRIFWLNLGGNPEAVRFVSAAMQELTAILASPPLGLNIAADELPATIIAVIASHLEVGNLDGCIAAIQSQANSEPFGVTVFCDPTHPAASAAQKRVRHARWGLSLQGVLSLTYVTGNKYALWHETLHLLGAQDHYDPATFRGTCELPSCLMQYAPSSQVIGDQPFLCSQTLEILRRLK